MVTIVQTENAPATMNTAPICNLAAGYINNGIKGSQGPSTNTVNKIQGVRLMALSGHVRMLVVNSFNMPVLMHMNMFCIVHMQMKMLMSLSFVCLP